MKYELILEMEHSELVNLGRLAEDMGYSITSLIENVIRQMIYRQLKSVSNINEMAYARSQS